MLLATTDAEFAAATSRLLDDLALRRSLGESARSWAAANIGIDHAVARFEQLYRRLIHGDE